MKNLTVTNTPSKIPHWRRVLAAVWRWLIEPSATVVEPERRLQARLLMAMLLVLLILGLLALTLSLFGFYSKAGESKTVASGFHWITLIAVLLLAIGYFLNRTALYPLAAMLAVGTVLSATFVTVIVSPQDFQYLFFLIIGGLFGSLFLSARATAIVFFVTLLGVLLLPTFTPGLSTSNNMNALFFILTVGGWS